MMFIENLNIKQGPEEIIIDVNSEVDSHDGLMILLRTLKM
jgi:hypothetical protein